MGITTTLVLLLATADGAVLDIGRDRDGNVIRVDFDERAGLRLDDLERYEGLFEAGEGETFFLVDDHKGLSGWQYARLKQAHRGTPVEDGSIVVVRHNEAITAALVSPVRGIGDVSARITEKEALSALARELQRTEGLKSPPEVTAERVALVLRGRRLVFRVEGSAGDLGFLTAEIDAVDASVRLGSVLSAIFTDATVMGFDKDGTTRWVAAGQDPANLQHVATTHDFPSIVAYDARAKKTGYAPFETMDGDFLSDGAPFVSALFGMQAGVAWGELLSDEALSAPLVTVGVSAPLWGAFANNNLAYVRSGEFPQGWITLPLEPAGPVTVRPGTYACIDGFMHEVAHAQSWRRAGFPDAASEKWGARALAEAFADAMAVGAEELATNTLSWEMCEKPGPALRNLENPFLSLPSPGSTLVGDNIWNATVASSAPDEHVLAGPANRWFFLLTQGQSTAPFTQGVGLDMASLLWWRAIIDLGHPNLDYVGARVATHEAARELCGVDTLLDQSAESAWAAVNNGSAYAPALATSPSDGDVDIDPWPATLWWQTAPNETSWLVQIDTQPTFDSVDLRTLDATSLSSVDAGATPNLRPETTYFWRVAPNPIEIDPANVPPACWRATHSFTTGKALAKSMWPPSDRTTPRHPWALEFSWTVPAGAKSSTIAIEGTQDGSPYAFKDEVQGTGNVGIKEDVAVDGYISWSVVVTGPDDLYDKNTSETRVDVVKTGLPKSALHGFDTGEVLSPWAFKAGWDEVKGATGYDLTAEDVGGTSKTWSFDASRLDGLLSVKAHFDEEDKKLNVKVVPVGPKVLPDQGASFQEKGGVDERWAWNAGTRTIPCFTAPIDTCRDPPAPIKAIPMDKTTHVEWSRIDGADAYLVSFYPFVTDGAPTGATPSRARFSAPFTQVIFDSSSSCGALGTCWIDVDAGVSSPGYGAGVTGKWVTVRASNMSLPSSAELSPLAHLSEFAPWLDPQFAGQTGDGALVVDIPPFEFDRSDGVVSFDTGTHHFGFNVSQDPRIYGPHGVEMRTFMGHDCLGTPELMETLSSPSGNTFHYGITIKPGWPAASVFNVPMSFEAKAVSHQSEIGSQVACLNLTTSPPVCGDGLPGNGEECDDGDADDTNACDNSCHVTLPTIACGSQIEHTGGHEVFEQIVDVGPSSKFRVVFNTLDIPDRVWVTGATSSWTSEHNGDTCMSTFDACGGDCLSDVLTSTSSGKITVHVEGGCDSTTNVTGTQWAFRVDCVDGGPPTLPPSEP